MKGLKTTALLTLVAASPAALGELIPMDENSLSLTTGQSGLTIEVNQQLITIGELAYKDQGFIALKDIALTGGDRVSAMDNLTVTLDVAGDGSDLGVNALGSQEFIDAGGSVNNLNEVDQNTAISDGDLIISLRATDDSETLDYGLTIGSVELGSSTSTIGDVNGGTTILSNVGISGNIGLIDIIIDNEGAGLNMNIFFNAVGEVELPFIATSLEFSIHNSRGNSQVALNGQSYAHVQMNVGQGVNSGGDDALAFNLQDFSGDIDLTNIQLGNNGNSIGDVYITDVQMSASTLIYGH